MSKPCVEYSPEGQEFWHEGWHDHVQDRECRYDALAGAGNPHADAYLAGWKAVDEFADEMQQRRAS